MGPHPRKKPFQVRGQQSAHTQVTLQLVQLGNKAALCNRQFVPSNREPTIWVPYSIIEDPHSLGRKDAQGFVRIKVQTWFAIKEGLIKE